MNDELSFLSAAQLARFDTLVALVRGRGRSPSAPLDESRYLLTACSMCCDYVPEPPGGRAGAPRTPRPKHKAQNYRALPPEIRRAIEEHSQSRLPNFTAGEKSFAALLLEAMKARQLDPPAVYKAAGVDRRSYSDIVNDERHPVAKLTVIRFALALHMTRGEADALLHSAGYTFSRASITDAIFDGCFEAGIYDFAKIDAIRRHYHQRALFK